MHVKDLLNHKERDVLTISENKTAMDAMKILNDEHIGALIAVDGNNEVTGILSERDILSRFAECSEGAKVKDIMTHREKLIIAHDHDTVEYAMKTFTQNKIRHLPVFDDTHLIGIISIGDAVRAVLEDTRTENKMLRDYIAGSYPVLT
jgi:CBS domain-containing protein